MTLTKLCLFKIKGNKLSSWLYINIHTFFAFTISETKANTPKLGQLKAAFR